MKKTFKAEGTVNILGDVKLFSTEFYVSGLFCEDTSRQKLIKRVAKANLVDESDVVINSIKRL